MSAGREDPFNVPLRGHLLIQASAGTGKTYALTTLVARLLVETEHTIDELLVVTFTNAATGELRDRLRRTLVATSTCLRAVDAESAESQAKSLLERWRAVGIDSATAHTRIARALQDFDRANVATIHSFCQRALTEFAFDGALPFGFELGGVDALEVKAAVKDFWRIHMVEAQAPLLEIARASDFTPEELAKWTGRRLANPESEVRGAPDLGADFEERFRAAFERWQQQTEATRATWRSHGAAYVESAQGLRWYANSRNKIRNAWNEARAVFDSVAGELSLATAMYLAPSNLANILRRGEVLPEGPLARDFEELGSAARAVEELSTAWLRVQRRRVLEDARTRLSRRAWEDRRLSFNDLLTELHRALTAPGGDLLAERIRQRYPRALIDEFQDTDRLQAHIFERIYPTDAEDTDLMVVGDPKQSIYRFRGADVFAYIKASRRIEHKLPLARNYRSTPGLVRAVNALFSRESPFLLPEIEHEPVQAAGDQTLELALAETMDAAPLQIRLLPLFGDARPRKNEVAALAAKHAANEVAELLRGGATLRGHPVTGADIAVLVRTTDQGQKMAQALRGVGVQCVEMDDTSVFATAEATDLHRLLAALADESSFAASARLRGALASELFGFGLGEVAELQDDDRRWSLWHERAASWRRMWTQSGIATLVRHLLFDPDIDGARHLLAADGGLRRLTNVLHLADLLREAESRERLAPAGLVEWFGRQDPEQRGDEATQLRLESDDDLVRIITMHRSKGLEFPIVFLPFAWYRLQPRTRSDAPSAEYHDRAEEDYPTILDLDPSDDTRLREAVEDQADELRLFYVAATRAQHRCVITWTPAPDAQYASPAWLVFGGDAEGEEPDVAYKSSAHHVRDLFRKDAWQAELSAWAGEHDDIAVQDVPQRPVSTGAEASPAPTLRARQLRRELARIRQMTSYSALAAQAGAAVSATEHDDVEVADHDQSEESAGDGDEVSESRVSRTLDLGRVDPELTPDDAADAFAFPRGPRAGDCLHGILEVRLDPERDPDAEVRRALRRWRIGEEWASVASRIVDNAWQAPLGESDGPSFRLSDLERPIPEMEFRLPAKELDRRQLGECLAAHGYPHPFTGQALPKVEGFLQGFIDLVACHDGRWYVIDYKSNWLGEELADYSPETLAAAMHHHGYHLQYLLYLTALHRMLQLRLPDYAYDRHMGGALYLFLRAMRPRLPGYGVFHDLPKRECIESIDACLAGAGDAIG
ncbi:MAG: exodeoxyribonuclease V subunit beta [Gammaproteobacteria bacterium]|nr:exodeoxyribonuclease V subunit beta [Gammaproteobacteria bacterium]